MLSTTNCGSGSATSPPPPPPPPPPQVKVAVTPVNSALFLGQTQTYAAAVTGTANTAVTWNVDGVAGGNSTVGVITVAGLYTAPQILPSPASVSIMATSAAEPSASASVTASLKSDVAVSVAPNAATLASGATQNFTATVTGSGNPNQAVSWNVNGIAGGNATVGMIASTGTETAIYTSPSMPPSMPTVTVKTTSVADPSKTASATVTIQCGAANSISPSTASVGLAQTQVFVASFCIPPATPINWDVNGIPGGNLALGTVTNSGGGTTTYTAPASLPPANPVTVRATSQTNPPQSVSASVTVVSTVVVSVSPPSASVAPGQRATFAATVTNSTNTTVNWAVNGTANGNASVGQICLPGSNPCAAPAGPVSDSVDYLAPAANPAPNTVTLAATSIADPSKSASAAVTIQCGAPNGISPAAASVGLGQSQPFLATLCIPPGTAITWDVNGTPGGNSTLGTVTNPGGNAATYTAPASLPPSNPVTVRATSQTNPPQSVSASVTVVSGLTVSITPGSANVSAGQRATFTATVTNSTNTTVNWTVNAIANGNPSIGQVCLSGSNPCAAPAGPVSGGVDYLAPVAVPALNPVTLTAKSQADPTRSASAAVTVFPPGPVTVSVSPPYAFVAAPGQSGNTQRFTALVTGTTNQDVTWGVASAVAGQGCSGSGCGTIDASGLFTAPSSAPSPNAITVTASSQVNPSQSASATVAITSGPVIEIVLPSSVIAGAASGFALAVQGLNFVPGSGTAASVLLLNGTARPTTCPSATRCTTALAPGDVNAAATLTVQAQNPGSPGALSNPVPFVIVPFTVSVDVISLTGAQPAATGKDLVVVEPTSAGATASQVNVDFIGFVTGGNTCSAQGSPLFITRPLSGSATFSLCVHGNGLDPSFTYEFSGPSPTDISLVATSLAGLFPNLIQLDVTITSATQPGPRTLFLTTANNDKAAASGMLEVK